MGNDSAASDMPFQQALRQRTGSCGDCSDKDAARSGDYAVVARSGHKRKGAPGPLTRCAFS